MSKVRRDAYSADRPARKHRVLIVCRWPVGGIRTYLSYIYRYFDPNEFEITLLANREIERVYIERNMAALGIEVVWVNPFLGKKLLVLSLARLLLRRRFDIIHSQGFISGFYVATVNKLFRVPHVLTIHGILEPEYFEGRLESVKRLLFRRGLRNVSVFHSVSHDMLTHVQKEFPSLKTCPARWVVINNGIDPAPFLEVAPGAGDRLRQKYQIERGTFIFGFFGRLIHQKGFNYVIDAVEILRKTNRTDRKLVVLVLNRSDFYREYRSDIERKKLEDYFLFAPTEPTIHEIIAGCDAVLMPSNWEAWGLLATEALCAGVPLIASTCIGLREAVDNTPAVTIPPRDAEALAKAMVQVMTDPDIKERHRRFRDEAAERFHVERSARQMIDLFKEISKAATKPVDAETA